MTAAIAVAGVAMTPCRARQAGELRISTQNVGDLVPVLFFRPLKKYFVSREFASRGSKSGVRIARNILEVCHLLGPPTAVQVPA